MIISLGGAGLKLNLNLFPMTEGLEPDLFYRITGDAGDFAYITSSMGCATKLIADIERSDLVGRILQNHPYPSTNMEYCWNILESDYPRASPTGVNVRFDHYFQDIQDVSLFQFVDVSVLQSDLLRGVKLVHIAGHPYFPLSTHSVKILKSAQQDPQDAPPKVPGAGAMWYIRNQLKLAHETGTYVSIDANALVFMIQRIKEAMADEFTKFDLVSYLSGWVGAIYLDEVTRHELEQLCVSDNVVDDLNEICTLIVYRDGTKTYCSHDGMPLHLYKDWIRPDNVDGISRGLYAGLCVNFLLKGVPMRDAIDDACDWANGMGM